MKHASQWFGIVTVAISLAAGAVAYHDRPSAIVTRILMPKVAPTLHDAICNDWSFTDTNIGCSFKVAAADFPALLNGHIFTRQSASGSSDALGGPKLGQPFEVAEQYSATLKNAKRDGSVMLWTDRRHRNVRLSYWVE